MITGRLNFWCVYETVRVETVNPANYKIAIYCVNIPNTLGAKLGRLH